MITTVAINNYKLRISIRYICLVTTENEKSLWNDHSYQIISIVRKHSLINTNVLFIYIDRMQG